MDKETFARLVVESTDSLYRVSMSILRNNSDCEEAVSEAITMAFEKLNSLKRDEYARTWLTRILINECLHIRRQQKRTMPILDDDESVVGKFGGLIDKNDVDFGRYIDLYEAMQYLNDEQRIVIVLFYYEGYSVKEIAKMTEVSQGTVKSRLSRARNQIKQLLKEDEYYA